MSLALNEEALRLLFVGRLLVAVDGVLVCCVCCCVLTFWLVQFQASDFAIRPSSYLLLTKICLTTAASSVFHLAKPLP